MCLDNRSTGRIGRRSFLTGTAAIAACSSLAGSGVASASIGQAPAPVAVEVAPGLVVLRRESWGADLTATAGLPTEAHGDVRVLLVHHSASDNGYDEAAVASKIRQFHGLHTGPEKGWPDVAYNFFVDRFGGVWEGRTGSLDGPVIGDATGGSQGFSQLVCLIGNHVTEDPTPAAVDALSRVLAWLARRYDVDPSPGATTTFTSRGSNRWPAGATVQTTTIAGHRDMSRTACPGDAAYARVVGDLPALVVERVAEQAAADEPPPTPAPSAAPATPGDGGTSPFRTPFLMAGAAVIATAVPIAVRRRRAGRVQDGGAPSSPSASASDEHEPSDTSS